MASHSALHRRTDIVLPKRRDAAGAGTRVAQVVVLFALVPILAFYLYPRIYDLVATPYRLDQAVVHANRYNPAIFKVVAAEKATLEAFSALDRMEAAVADVRATDARVSEELTVLIGQIRGDLQATLNNAVASVNGLNDSLTALDAEIRALYGPSDGADEALAANRARLAGILADTRATAARVHAARQEADQSADNVSGG